MSEEPRRPFRATDVITGAVSRSAPDTQRAPRRVRKQVSLHLTFAQIQILDELHLRLNAPDLPNRIEKSELGGLAIEILDRLLPKERKFANLEEILKYLDTQVPRPTSHP